MNKLLKQNQLIHHKRITIYFSEFARRILIEQKCEITFTCQLFTERVNSLHKYHNENNDDTQHMQLD